MIFGHVFNKFHMSFQDKYVEDEGNNYSWLLVSSTIPKTEFNLNYGRLQFNTQLADHFHSLPVV